MRKLVLSSTAILFALVSIAQAKSIHIYEGAFDGQKVIYTTDEYGETKSATAYEVREGTYIIYDGSPNATIVNDFSDYSNRDSE